MLIDLLNSSNYIMINRDAVKIFGLNTAVYCSELLNIYKKAVNKKVIFNDKYFKVDRNYILKQTTLEVEDQTKCDLNLSKVGVIEIDPENPDLICFNVETFASLLSCEDIHILDAVSKKVKVQKVKGTKSSARDRIILNLKESIECKTYDILIALRGWIDSVMSNPNKYLSNQQVSIFKEKVDDYCDGDLQKALRIIEIATVHQYVDCQWAINVYEKENTVNSKPNNYGSNTIRTTSQKRTEKTDLGEEVF